MTDPRLDELLASLRRERNARRTVERLLVIREGELRELKQELERMTSGLEATVTERSQDLVRARDAAMRASREQASLLAEMSHEVRTPLHTILGLAEQLRLELRTTEHRSAIGRIVDNAARLAALIDDFLDLSRIGSGRSTVEIATFDVRALVENAADVVSPAASRKGLGLVIDVDPELPGELLGDARKLNQIVLNLLSNAVKYTVRGRVRIDVSFARHEARLDLEIVVRDTGPGIDAADLKRVFEPFVRGASSETQLGTGLGLALVKNLAEQMGGSVHAISERGRGSTFHVRVPLGFLDTSTNAEPRFEGVSVLLVVPDAERRETIARLLHRERAQVLQSPSWAFAREAFEPTSCHVAVVEADANDRALLVADRGRPPWQGLAFVVVVDDASAVGTSLRTLGAHAALETPVKRDRLFSAVELALGRRRPESHLPRSGPTSVRTLRPMRALLVEDDPDNRSLLARWLTEIGFEVRTESDGRAGVVALEQERFDLVVTDVAMPHKSGVELIFALRTLEARLGSHRTPVVVVTASAFEATRAECTKAGADVFLAKPTSLAALANAASSVVDARWSVLVVDDSVDVRDVTKAFLASRPEFVVSEATDGATALEVVRGRRVDVVLMDIEMPGMGGVEAVRAIRASHELAELRVVACTGHREPSEHRRYLDAGFDAVLVKPFTRQELQRTLGSVTTQARVAPSGSQEASPARSPAAAEPPTVLVDPDILDLVPRFLENRRADVARMKQLLANGDLPAIRRIAHSAKGTGGGYGFHEVTRIGARLEAAAESGDATRVHADLVELAAYLATVQYVQRT